MDPVADAASREHFLDLIRGRRRGFVASLARFGLWLLSLGYGVVIRLRNRAYTMGLLPVVRTTVPVVSVGNLSVGGTGKTPFVEYIAAFYRDRERLVAILSRGYGSEGGRNDEALVLEENLPDVPHFQGPDRAALAATAVEECESEVLVLDDGFQHRRLARDLDIVLIDAGAPLDHLLPRGLMREPASGLRRADIIVLTRCDQADPVGLRRRLARIAPGKLVAEAVHRPTYLLSTSGQESLDKLKCHPVAAFCGLGNPDAFRRTLFDLGADIKDFRIYPDHHPYSRDDVADLARWAESQPRDTWLVTTQKDFVKLRVDSLSGRPLWALRVQMELRGGKEEVESRLAAVGTDQGKEGNRTNSDGSESDGAASSTGTSVSGCDGTASPQSPGQGGLTS
ncbi:MAG: tetraacyldisaccharide 4'-kinase [Planctomycetia bacterium]|nr:tetraacyldisaccharide 4'-kinase [Planctomycetia bacterium]